MSETEFELELEMALLLPSAPATWEAAVHEAAFLLIGAGQAWRPNRWDLSTLALTLFARTYTGDRAPGEVPVTELHEALYEAEDCEPRIRAEIDQAMTATGQGWDHTSVRGTPLWSIVSGVGNQYGFDRGGSLANDVEPPRPGPSPMRASAGRLAQLFANYPAEAREQAVVPAVASGPLIVDANRIQIVQAASLRPLRCPQDCEVRTVQVDGPQVLQVCDRGHESSLWELEADRVRLALARASGVRPSIQGRHQVEELLVASSTLPRYSDPKQVNFFLREPAHPIVGRDDVLDRVQGLIVGRDRT